MPNAAMPRDAADLQAVLDASGVVGSWVHDHWAGRLTVLGPLAGLLGLDPEAAANGISVAEFLDRTHPDDRIRIESYLHAAGEAGGPMEAEFRTRGPAGVRKLLMRGRFERDATGRAPRGRGIAIDLTEGHAASLDQSERLVNRMAEHAIALRGLAEVLGRPALTGAADALMVEVGYELARYLRAPDGGRPH